MRAVWLIGAMMLLSGFTNHEVYLEKTKEFGWKFIETECVADGCSYEDTESGLHFEIMEFGYRMWYPDNRKLTLETSITDIARVMPFPSVRQDLRTAFIQILRGESEFVVIDDDEKYLKLTNDSTLTVIFKGAKPDPYQW